MFDNNTDASVDATQNTEWTGATIPNYVGMKYDDVVKKDETDDTITVYKNYSDDYSDEYPEGVVMSQFPSVVNLTSQSCIWE